jgi:hypothetical protein
LSSISRVLSFEEGLLASKARQRSGLASPQLSGRKTLMILDGVIGRELPRNTGGVEQAKRGAPPGPTEHAMLEAAIQMDLITPEQAEALVEKGKTLGEWLVEQEAGVAIEPRKAKQRILDALGVLALLLLNLAVLAGFSWIVLRVLRSL